MNKTTPTKKAENDLPPKVLHTLQSEFGSETNFEISKSFKLNIGQIVSLTKLISKVYRKQTEISDLEKSISQLIDVESEQAKKLALEICGKRLLILDEDWFEGQVAKKITALGGNPGEYADFIKKYEHELKEEKEQLAAEEAEGKEDKTVDKKVPLVISNPAEEYKGLKIVFTTQLKEILEIGGYALKLDLTARVVMLLINDESQKYQKELLGTLEHSEELITKNKIKLKNEKVAPSAANWIKDYISHIGIENIMSSIEKARYLTEAENVKALKPEEKKVVSDLLEIYKSIKKFYETSKKMSIEDISIFPLSAEEGAEYAESLRKMEEEEEEASGAKEEGSVDIMDLIKDKSADREKIDQNKEKIITETRKEYQKVADLLEDYLLRRKKHEIIACLEVLSETGALDTLFAKDPRYQAFEIGYLKRNNLQGQEEDFKSNPFQTKYVQYFLKFVFLERLGMSENEGARQAAKLSNIFQQKGVTEYSQLAYLDLSDSQFKWS